MKKQVSKQTRFGFCNSDLGFLVCFGFRYSDFGFYIDPGGKIDAVYLNPQPINIAKAEATRDDSKLNIFVELRAPNYPGSTYTLAYDPAHDQLRGSYFQASLQQTFNVNFVRMK